MHRTFVALALVAFVSLANAEIIGFGFTGQVTAVGPSILGLNPALGDPVTGSFGYDTELPDDAPHVSFLGVYTQFPPHRLIVNIGASSAWSGTAAGISVFNDFGGNVEDSFSVSSQPAVVNGIQASDVVVSINLASASTGVFSNEDLPSALELADFELWQYGKINSGRVNVTYVDFSIDSITRLATLPPDPGPGLLLPVPSTLLLLLSGLLALTIPAARSWGGVHASGAAPLRSPARSSARRSPRRDWIPEV